MGRWLEVVKTVDDPYRPGIRREELEAKLTERLIGETAAHPLVYCTRYLPASVRTEFPALNNLDLNSPGYIDELQILDVARATEVLAELQRLLQLCRRQVFIRGFDAGAFFDLWRDGQPAEEFQEWILKLEGLFRMAVDRRAFIRLML